MSNKSVFVRVLYLLKDPTGVEYAFECPENLRTEFTYLDPPESKSRGHMVPKRGESAENATPIFDRGKIRKCCILQNIVMVIHIFNVFWSTKSIPMVNFTLKCFPDMFMATPICDRGKSLVKIWISVHFSEYKHVIIHFW